MANVNWEHGSPYDRGRADSYYRRKFDPHWYDYSAKVFLGQRVKIEPGTPEFDQYRQGFRDNEAEGDYKDWG